MSAIFKKIAAYLGGVLLLALLAGNVIVYYSIIKFSDSKSELSAMVATKEADVQKLQDLNDSLDQSVRALQGQLALAKANLELSESLKDERNRTFEQRKAQTTGALHAPDAQDWSNKPVPYSVRRLFPESPSSSGRTD